MPKAITQDEFEDELKNTKGVVFVDFWAAWCAPCRALAPILEQLDQENDDITVFKVDVDSNQQLAQKEGIQGIPTVKMYKDGKEVQTLVGLMPKAHYAHLASEAA